MATGKRSRSETEDSSSLCLADDDSSAVSTSSPDVAVASKRTRKSAPVDKLLGVFELCEQVLDYLPMYDLLHVTLVCRAFKVNVDDSHRLQKKLFLAPDLPRVKCAMPPSGTLLSGTKAEQHIAATAAAGEDTTGEFTCCTLHPALHLEPQHFGLAASRNRCIGMVRYAALRYKSQIQLHTTDTALVRRSIWSLTKTGCKPSGLDGVLITQPPVTFVEVMVALRPGAYASDSVSNATGVTFGDVFKAATEIAAGIPYVSSRGWCISFDSRVLVLSPEARDAAERAGELDSENDSTRLVLKDGEYVLQEGGFEFV